MKDSHATPFSATLPIALTAGDPAGIGPELVLRFLQSQPLTQRRDYWVYGDPIILAREAQRLALDMPFDIQPNRDPSLSVQTIRLIPCSNLTADQPLGQVRAEAGAAAAAAITKAAQDALAGHVGALVTAPIHKEALAAAGIPYPGHTEMLAALAGVAEVRMMLANDELRTVLVTVHMALRDAILAITTDRVLHTIQMTQNALQRAGIAAPRIAVAGLNPHAGEGGLFGREEIDQIEPAIRQARSLGVDASGPWSPDTVFMRARGFREFDVVVAMTHDHGLIPVKYLGLDAGVNATIGLPFVRTSPDHGTAFDIAGQGRADIRSFAAAVAMAQSLCSPTPRAP
jgi:4-hydroxythreonine-4-phosphate dehydrogenase